MDFPPPLWVALTTSSFLYWHYCKKIGKNRQMKSLEAEPVVVWLVSSCVQGGPGRSWEGQRAPGLGPRQGHDHSGPKSMHWGLLRNSSEAGQCKKKKISVFAYPHCLSCPVGINQEYLEENPRTLTQEMAATPSSSWAQSPYQPGCYSPLFVSITQDGWDH